MVWEDGVGTREESDKHNPRQTSQQEKEDHETTHLPFHSSCRHCVMGTGREDYCRKTMEEERRVPEVHLDYMFMGDQKEGKTLALSVARERERQGLCSVQWFRGRRRENGFAERRGVCFLADSAHSTLSAHQYSTYIRKLTWLIFSRFQT